MYWFEKLLQKLEAKFGHLGISHLPLYLVASNAFVFFLAAVRPSYLELLTFNGAKILRGQIWRLFTYIFIPPTDSVIFIIFALYILYIFGSALEAQWGSFRLTLYYLLGMLGTTIIGFIFPQGGLTNAYLNTSLFLAFATLFPDFMLYLFFILPIKVKYLAILTWIGILLSIVFGPVVAKCIALVSVLNYLLFFWPMLVERAKLMNRGPHPLPAFSQPVNAAIHTCHACGLTEKTNPNLEFRVCDCGKEFCEEHLHSHAHEISRS